MKALRPQARSSTTIDTGSSAYGSGGSLTYRRWSVSREAWLGWIRLEGA
jgi:hypothetical protein